MRRFKANRPCAVSAGAEAAAMVDSANLKIERVLVRDEPFRVRDAYFLRSCLVVLVKEHVIVEGKKVKFGKLPTFYRARNGRVNWYWRPLWNSLEFRQSGCIVEYQFICHLLC